MHKMGSHTLSLLVIFLASIALGTAFKCYICAGSENSDCAKGKESAMSVASCKAPGDRLRPYSFYNIAHDGSEQQDAALKPVCLKFVGTDYQPKLVVRECGFFPSKIDACDFLQEHAAITGCKACKTDLCNQNAQLRQYSYDLNDVE